MRTTPRPSAGSPPAACVSVRRPISQDTSRPWIRLDRVVKVQRVVAAAGLIVLWPVAASSPPLLAMALVAAALAAVVVFETLKYATVRRELLETPPE